MYSYSYNSNTQAFLITAYMLIKQCSSCAIIVYYVIVWHACILQCIQMPGILNNTIQCTFNYVKHACQTVCVCKVMHAHVQLHDYYNVCTVSQVETVILTCMSGKSDKTMLPMQNTCISPSHAQSAVWECMLHAAWLFCWLHAVAIYISGIHSLFL